MKIIFFVVLITVGYIYGMIQLERMRAEGLQQLTSDIYYNHSSSQSQEVEDTITITIEGEVKRPTNYAILPGTTLQDLLELCGGLLSTADLDSLDFSLEFTTDSIFYVAPMAEKKVSINYGGVEALDELPGIGLVLANRIIEYRNANGYFRCLEEVMNVNGIGTSLYKSIRDFIRLTP